MSDMGVTIDTTELDRIMRDLNVNTNEAVKSIAFDVEGEIKKVATDMKIYKSGAFISSIKAEYIGGELSGWWVTDGVDYGIWQEIGHHNVPARPSFSTGVENVSGRLAEQFKRLFK